MGKIVTEKSRGRPKKDNPRKNQVKVKMTDEEYKVIVDLCESLGITKTDLIISAIALYREDQKK